jgi:hypothetical protein
VWHTQTLAEHLARTTTLQASAVKASKLFSLSCYKPAQPARLAAKFTPAYMCKCPYSLSAPLIIVTTCVSLLPGPCAGSCVDAAAASGLHTPYLITSLLDDWNILRWCLTNASLLQHMPHMQSTGAGFCSIQEASQRILLMGSGHLLQKRVCGRGGHASGTVPVWLSEDDMLNFHSLTLLIQGTMLHFADLNTTLADVQVCKQACKQHHCQ